MVYPAKGLKSPCRFYREVLGFRELYRPDLPFGGAFLEAGGFTLHIAEEDPSVGFGDSYLQVRLASDSQQAICIYSSGCLKTDKAQTGP